MTLLAGSMRRVGVAVGGLGGALTAHTAYLLSRDEFDGRQRAQQAPATPHHHTSAVREAMGTFDVLIISGPGAHESASDFVLSDSSSLRVAPARHESFREALRGLRVPPALPVWPSAILAAAIVRRTAEPPLEFLWDGACGGQALVCFAQPDLADPEVRLWCADRAGKVRRQGLPEGVSWGCSWGPIEQTPGPRDSLGCLLCATFAV